MKKIAFEYFTTQPGYQLATAPKVRAYVKKMWLNGHELGDVCRAIISDRLGIDSVIAFKKFLLCWVTVDVDTDENTREILRAFIDYVETIYNEFEAEFEARSLETLRKFNPGAAAFLEQWQKEAANN